MKAGSSNNVGSWLRQYWWLAYCCLVPYLLGTAALWTLYISECYAGLLFLVGSLLLPALFSKLVALCFLQPTRSWDILLLASVVYVIDVFTALFIYGILFYSGGALLFARMGFNGVMVLAWATCFFTLLTADVTALAIARSLTRKAFLLMTVTTLALAGWLGNILVFLFQAPH